MPRKKQHSTVTLITHNGTDFVMTTGSSDVVKETIAKLPPGTEYALVSGSPLKVRTELTFESPEPAVKKTRAKAEPKVRTKTPVVPPTVPVDAELRLE